MSKGVWRCPCGPPDKSVGVLECWRCPGVGGPPDKRAQLSGHCQGEEAFIERRFENCLQWESIPASQCC